MRASRLATMIAGTVLVVTGCGEDVRDTVAPGGLTDPDFDAIYGDLEPLFEGCTGAIGDNVWLDTNANGVRELGEPVVTGVVVNLFDGNGEFIASNASSDFGTYIFFGLCTGEYLLDVDESTLPVGLTWAPCNVGPDDTDNDCDRVLVTLSEGTPANMTIDFGFMDALPEEPEDPEGCRPRYWRRHLDGWPAAYQPDITFAEVFGRFVEGDPTLEDALRRQVPRRRAFMRHAAAAILNAASPDVNYLYSVEETISIVQQAFDSGQFRAARRTLRSANREGCPLNSSGSGGSGE